MAPPPTSTTSDKTACTALRTVADNNQQLYQQAEKKAQIMIQVNALMISVILLSMRSTKPAKLFPQFPPDQFITGMHATIKDAEHIYAYLTREIYSQSQDLSRKYYYLHRAYDAFILGLAINIPATILIVVL